MAKNPLQQFARAMRIAELRADGLTGLEILEATGLTERQLYYAERQDAEREQHHRRQHMSGAPKSGEIFAAARGTEVENLNQWEDIERKDQRIKELGAEVAALTKERDHALAQMDALESALERTIARLTAERDEARAELLDAGRAKP